MTDRLERTTVALSPAIIRQLDAIARARKTTRAAVLRDAVTGYCDDYEAGPETRRRMAMVAEYSQAALDVILRERYPQRVDQVVAVTAERMEKFHGGR